jgi:heat shock protein HslJ
MKRVPLLSLFISFGFLSLVACASAQKNDIDNLIGVVWLLDELNGQKLFPGSTITAQFSVEGKVSGSAGCNRYSGSFVINAKNIKFTTPMAATRMMCEADIIDQETAFFNALGDVSLYNIDSSQLIFSNSANTQRLKFRPQSQDLAGTSWQVLTHNNGKQAVVNVISGTTLTAEFGKNGQVAGSSGCNTFSGAYQVNGNQINIGPLGSTKKNCNSPEGVMEQETQYLLALQTADNYIIQGHSLELRTQSGALAVKLTTSQ